MMLAKCAYPDSAILHVPHESTVIPTDLRGQFILSDQDLHNEVLRMTDHFTGILFDAQAAGIRAVRAAVSRLVVDVERFPSDSDEPMAGHGMGVIYTHTADHQIMRRRLTKRERKHLLQQYYFSHHAELERVVQATLARHGKAIILDCHSFPSQSQLHEPESTIKRPDVCIGSDGFHTPPALCRSFVAAFEAEGLSVAENYPYKGALVPSAYYQKNANVMAIMVEVNRNLYMDEPAGKPSRTFNRCRVKVANTCQRVLREFEKAALWPV